MLCATCPATNTNSLQTTVGTKPEVGAEAKPSGWILPIVKFGFEWWPNPIAAVVVSYTVSSAVLILSALGRAGGSIPIIDHPGVLWFAAVGLCNGLSVLAIYGALEYGPVAIISPLIASYRLVTLLLSRAFLKRIAEISARWGGRRESRRSASVLIGSRLDPRRRTLDSLARWTNWLR